MIMQVYELNLDGLVGPTHHYAGLSPGNLASISNAQSLSNPQAAARQGLAKMRLLHRMGFKQALLPPHQRPNLQLLDQLGFSGTPAQQIEKANRIAPELLSACYSASYMWAANAATVSASLDTQDHRVHFTAANLVSNLHRYQEAAFSKYLLETIFNDEATFVHHAILPRSLFSADEGAANHNRLCSSHHSPAINLFVFGRQAIKSHYGEGPYKYPARQTLEASQAIARTHRLNSDKVIYARQNPKAIDQGVFHNDVIAVANESIFLVHEEAFVQQADVIANLRLKADFPLQIIEVNKQRITLNEAVSSYFFNSQLLTLPGSSQMILISPIECQNNRKVKDFIDELIADSMNPITGIYYLDLRQSMRNGGGPACLRLRVPLTKQELDVMQHGVLVTEHLLDCLDNWVMRHYRSELCAQDLADPQLINENFYALDELSQLLALGSIYPFQREIMS